MIRFIGFYDYTVILTYMSLLSALIGMVQAVQGNFIAAIGCLAFSGLCDAFDGRVARAKKNRTEDQKNFGIQLDSLVDVVAFGVLPALICYHMGVQGILGLVLVFFYCTCAVIRLAFFNMLEAKRQKEEGGCNKSYRGLPVTSASFIFPLVFCTQFFLPADFFTAFLYITLGIVGFLFIFDFKMPKLGLRGILILIGIVTVVAGIVFALTQFKKPVDSESEPTAAAALTGEFYEA